MGTGMGFKVGSDLGFVELVASSSHVGERLKASSRPVRSSRKPRAVRAKPSRIADRGPGEAPGWPGSWQAVLHTMPRRFSGV